MHDDPVAGDPLLHVHVYAAHAVPLKKYPALHDAHLAPLLVHADPVAGDPLAHVHSHWFEEEAIEPRLTPRNIWVWVAVLKTHDGPQSGSWS